MARVLVVDDSAVVRRAFLELLRPYGFEVESASDALLAWPKLLSSHFDVMVLDLELPRMGGEAFLRKVMRERPMPVVICSGHVGSGSAQAMRALASGAVELIPKPALGTREFLEEQAPQLAALFALLAETAPRHPRAGPAVREEAVEPRADRVVALGASTGGPEALEAIFRDLPADAPPLLVVQHMPRDYTAAFARRLGSVSRLEVREAKGGEPLERGLALVAPGDCHLTVSRDGLRAVVGVGPKEHHHRPSVDVLFRSMVEPLGRRTLGVLLTGMGEDGAQGLLQLKAAGALTLAQDEASCVVFGMPAAAIRRGAAARVLSPEQIARVVARS